MVKKYFKQNWSQKFKTLIWIISSPNTEELGHHSETNKAYLRNVFQPSAQSNEHKKHRWRFKKCNWTLVSSLYHGNDEDHAGVDVGDGGGQNYQDIHVGSAVF